jgi:hypothetical protein
MKALYAIALTLVVGTIMAQSPEPLVIESVTETFVGFVRQDGTVVCGPLRDFQPSTPAVPVIVDL